MDYDDFHLNCNLSGVINLGIPYNGYPNQVVFSEQKNGIEGLLLDYSMFRKNNWDCTLYNDCVKFIAVSECKKVSWNVLNMGIHALNGKVYDNVALVCSNTLFDKVKILAIGDVKDFGIKCIANVYVAIPKAVNYLISGVLFSGTSGKPIPMKNINPNNIRTMKDILNKCR